MISAQATEERLCAGKRLGPAPLNLISVERADLRWAAEATTAEVFKSSECFLIEVRGFSGRARSGVAGSAAVTNTNQRNVAPPRTTRAAHDLVLVAMCGTGARGSGRPDPARPGR